MPHPFTLEEAIQDLTLLVARDRKQALIYGSLSITDSARRYTKQADLLDYCAEQLARLQDLER